MSRLLLQMSHVRTCFQSFPLFEDLSLSVHYGDRIAVIGENGCGKTTLLRLMAGLVPPDEGLIDRAPALVVGFLPQEASASDEGGTVRGFLRGDRLIELERTMDECLSRGDIRAWEHIHGEYERLGGYRSTPPEEVLYGLGLEAVLDAPIRTLSGGQRTRAALAKALIEAPDLLLLDEPTNHMDWAMVDWLHDFLAHRSGATVVVSHDRAFLNASCNRLVELHDGTLAWYEGSYDWYLSERERATVAEGEAYEAQRREQKSLKQAIKAATFARPAHSPPTDRNIMAYDKRGESHQKSTARVIRTQKHRLEELEAHPLKNPRPRSIQGLHFDSSSLATDLAIDIEDASKSFDGLPLFSGLTCTLRRGERIVLTGPNGCGKTTLLRCIAGQTALDRGSIRYASDVRMAYLDQELAQLRGEESALDYFSRVHTLSESGVRSELHKAALSGQDLLSRPLSSLSVGQRTRLLLLSLVLQRPNVLLLDEPTNHLDLKTLEAFEAALLGFEGTLLAVSHDRTFANRIATQQWMWGVDL